MVLPGFQNPDVSSSLSLTTTPSVRCSASPPAPGLQGSLEWDKGPLLLLSPNSVCVLTPDTGSCLSPCHWPHPIPNDLSPPAGLKGA